MQKLFLFFLGERLMFFSVALQRIFSAHLLHCCCVTYLFFFKFLIKQEALVSENCWDFFFCIIWFENMLVQDTMEWIKHVTLHSWLSLCWFCYMNIKWILTKNDRGWSLSLQFDTFRPFLTITHTNKQVFAQRLYVKINLIFGFSRIILHITILRLIC